MHPICQLGDVARFRSLSRNARSLSSPPHLLAQGVRSVFALLPANPCGKSIGVWGVKSFMRCPTVYT